MGKVAFFDRKLFNDGGQLDRGLHRNVHSQSSAILNIFPKNPRLGWLACQ
jgi:hypothetical protein